MAADNEGNGSGSDRPRHRDNDDQRAPLEGEARQGTKADSKAEARGEARETIGNNARGTDADPYGPEGNDKTRGRPISDRFDSDLNQS